MMRKERKAPSDAATTVRRDAEQIAREAEATIAELRALRAAAGEVAAHGPEVRQLAAAGCGRSLDAKDEDGEVLWLLASVRERFVAIATLPPEKMDDPDELRRIVRATRTPGEARTTRWRPETEDEDVAILAMNGRAFRAEGFPAWLRAELRARGVPPPAGRGDADAGGSFEDGDRKGAGAPHPPNRRRT